MGRQETIAFRRLSGGASSVKWFPLADCTIYAMEQRGEFPRRFALSPRCVVWDMSEVEAWLVQRRSSALARAAHPDVKQRRSRPVKVRDRARKSSSKAE